MTAAATRFSVRKASLAVAFDEALAHFLVAEWLRCRPVRDAEMGIAHHEEVRLLTGFIQTPELHSVHHQLDVHHYNYADIPLWDRLFGTYRDADEFVPECGFPRHNERKLAQMLAFRNVYDD